MAQHTLSTSASIDGLMNNDYSTANGEKGGPNGKLHHMTSNDSIAVPRDLFEKMYLQPKQAIEQKVPDELRKRFANPTPLCLAGFLVSSLPLACDLMGWRGAGASGAASLPVYLLMGGILEIIGGILQFFIGNTFPFIFFLTFATFWMSFGITTALAATGATNAPDYASGLAFWFIAMAVLTFFFTIGALRTNAILVFMMACLTVAFCLMAAMYWHQNAGNMALAHALQVGAGALWFALSMAGFYLFFAQLLEVTDFPAAIPVGDLSRLIPGGIELAVKHGKIEIPDKYKEQYEQYKKK